MNSRKLRRRKYVTAVDNYVSSNLDIDGREAIVIAGNFTLDGEVANVAQYDISSGT
jgi:hypothetical protein